MKGPSDYAHEARFLLRLLTASRSCISPRKRNTNGTWGWGAGRAVATLLSQASLDPSRPSCNLGMGSGGKLQAGKPHFVGDPGALNFLEEFWDAWQLAPLSTEGEIKEVSSMGTQHLPTSSASPAAQTGDYVLSRMLL